MENSSKEQWIRERVALLTAGGAAPEHAFQAASNEWKSRNESTPLEGEVISKRETPAPKQRRKDAIASHLQPDMFGLPMTAPSVQRMEPKKPLGIMPRLPDGNSAMPNVLARVPMFVPSNSKKSKRRRNKEILLSRRDIRIAVDGPMLDMRDNLVWLALVGLYQGKVAGTRHRVKVTEILEKISPSKGGTSYRGFWTSVTDLALNSFICAANSDFDFQDPRAWEFERETANTKQREITRLIAEPRIDEATGLFEYAIPDMALQLFGEGYSLISLEERKKIPAKDELAMWLHNYAETHKSGKEHKALIAELRDWSGQSDMRLDNFKRGLKRALDVLAKVGIVQDVRLTATHAIWMKPIRIGLLPRLVELSGGIPMEMSIADLSRAVAWKSGTPRLIASLEKAIAAGMEAGILTEGALLPGVDKEPMRVRWAA